MSFASLISFFLIYILIFMPPAVECDEKKGGSITLTLKSFTFPDNLMDNTKDKKSTQKDVGRGKRSMGVLFEMANNLVNPHIYGPAIVNVGKLAIPILTHFLNQFVLNTVTTASDPGRFDPPGRRRQTPYTPPKNILYTYNVTYRSTRHKVFNSTVYPTDKAYKYLVRKFYKFGRIEDISITAEFPDPDSSNKTSTNSTLKHLIDHKDNKTVTDKTEQKEPKTPKPQIEPEKEKKIQIVFGAKNKSEIRKNTEDLTRKNVTSEKNHTLDKLHPMTKGSHKIGNESLLQGESLGHKKKEKESHEHAEKHQNDPKRKVFPQKNETDLNPKREKHPQQKNETHLHGKDTTHGHEETKKGPHQKDDRKKGKEPLPKMNELLNSVKKYSNRNQIWKTTPSPQFIVRENVSNNATEQHEKDRQNSARENLFRPSIRQNQNKEHKNVSLSGLFTPTNATNQKDHHLQETTIKNRPHILKEPSHPEKAPRVEYAPSNKNVVPKENVNLNRNIPLHKNVPIRQNIPRVEELPAKENVQPKGTINEPPKKYVLPREKVPPGPLTGRKSPEVERFKSQPPPNKFSNVIDRPFQTNEFDRVGDRNPIVTELAANTGTVREIPPNQDIVVIEPPQVEQQIRHEPQHPKLKDYTQTPIQIYSNRNNPQVAPHPYNRPIQNANPNIPNVKEIPKNTIIERLEDEPPGRTDNHAHRNMRNDKNDYFSNKSSALNLIAKRHIGNKQK